MVCKALEAGYPDSPALPEATALFSKGYNSPATFREKLVNAGYKDLQISTYSFKPMVEAERFAEATAALVQIALGRLWTEEQRLALKEKKLQDVILNYLSANYDNGIWDGEMEGIIASGRK